MLTYKKYKKLMKIEYVKELLIEADFNVLEASRMSGMHRNTINQIVDTNKDLKKFLKSGRKMRRLSRGR